jgi:hypothetical protein
MGARAGRIVSRAEVPGDDRRLKKIPVRPSTTVSVAPPARKATTGLPAAMASTGAIPKSSIPGTRYARQRANKSTRSCRST